MEAIEDEEPIYDLAVECERLFVQQITRLKDEDQPNGAKILSELSQRFAAWTAFLGVFAESNMCLDRRLRRHVEIQDQVLLLLDIVLRSLIHCVSSCVRSKTIIFDRDDSSDRIDIGLSDACQPSLQPLCISIYNLEAISGAIERLNHLGISIRQSSVTNQAIKARKFAEKFDLASFEGVAYLSMKTLYPDASVELLEQLTQSMTETYTRFLHRKDRQEQLQVPRSRPRTAIPLSTIAEEPDGDGDVESPMDNQIKVRQGGENFTTRMLQRRSAHTLLISEPTTVNSQEVRKRFQKTLSPTVNDKTMSILVNQVDYPQPAKGSSTCEWCFSPLPTDSFEGAKWRRHVNEDHEPYVCISENCSKSLRRFATSTQWLEHMVTAHGKLWHREVNVPPSWACPLCSDEDSTFSRPNDLTGHLENLHAGTFTVTQVQAIVRQSRFRSSRAQDICPLCCLPVRGQLDSLSKERGNDNGYPSSEQPRNEASRENKNKRIKTETGRTHLDHNHESNLKTKNKHREPKITYGPSSSNPASLELIASHVAAHLQGIMLLTLRLISMDVEMDVSADHQSTSGSTDDQSSLISSSERSLYQDMDSIEDFSLHREGAFDPENDLPSEQIVPDCEHIDWHVVPRRYEAPPEPEDLEEFLSNYPTGKPSHKDYLGQDLEEFISNPPMGASPDQDYLGWDLENFISNPPTEGLQDKGNLGQDLEKFISNAPG
ncbi:hypothetical protein N7537_004964 [Penicillium hordei]|uniref:C2H2-type domain-containing protein n=1 Tax=Penicillium hordei TaxID=40994 RepID=A0AAD6EC89_9EURO|nr:uncharacterized protein N7537_004964 [Penicillium hordei]KAJ5608345.1 hypothetical protein N7537_004964 [Penicillium hordei]